MYRTTLTVAAALLLASTSAATAQNVEMTYHETGANTALGSFQTFPLKMSPTKPPEVKRQPSDLKTPIYGVLKLGPAEKPGSFTVVLSDPAGKDPAIYIDANGDGDLTNDPKAEWKSQSYKKNETDFTRHAGSASFQIPYGGTDRRPAKIEFFFLDPSDPSRSGDKNTLFLYRDYGLSGSVKVGKASYDAYLSDEGLVGDFRGKAAGKSSGVVLYVDVNADHKFDRKTEGFDVRQPIAIKDQRLEIQNLQADGVKFTLAKPGKDDKLGKKSEDAGPQIPASNLSVGTGVFPFKGKDLAGKQISFPGDYRGKLVLLDFWATWCPPCREEIPGLVEAYEQFKKDDFAVLGVTLDNANSDKQVIKFASEKKMSWPQIYDGGGWKAAVAVKYSINSVPAAFLVDGDNGKILATGTSLRGANLKPTIEKALKDRKAQKK